MKLENIDTDMKRNQYNHRPFLDRLCAAPYSSKALVKLGYVKLEKLTEIIRSLGFRVSGEDVPKSTAVTPRASRVMELKQWL